MSGTVLNVKGDHGTFLSVYSMCSGSLYSGTLSSHFVCAYTRRLTLPIAICLGGMKMNSRSSSTAEGTHLYYFCFFLATLQKSDLLQTVSQGMNRVLNFDVHLQAFGKIHPNQNRITLCKYQPCTVAAKSPKGRLAFCELMDSDE